MERFVKMSTFQEKICEVLSVHVYVNFLQIFTTLQTLNGVCDSHTGKNKNKGLILKTAKQTWNKVEICQQRLDIITRAH